MMQTDFDAAMRTVQEQTRRLVLILGIRFLANLFDKCDFFRRFGILYLEKSHGKLPDLRSWFPIMKVSFSLLLLRVLSLATDVFTNLLAKGLKKS